MRFVDLCVLKCVGRVSIYICFIIIIFFVVVNKIFLSVIYFEKDICIINKNKLFKYIKIDKMNFKKLKYFGII